MLSQVCAESRRAPPGERGGCLHHAAFYRRQVLLYRLSPARVQVQAWRLRKWWERRGEDETLRQLVERMIHHEVGTEIYGEDVR